MLVSAQLAQVLRAAALAGAAERGGGRQGPADRSEGLARLEDRAMGEGGTTVF